MSEISKERQNELEKVIIDQMEELQVPFDIIELAERHNFDVRTGQLPDGIEGILLVNEKEKKKIISFDSRSAFEHVRFIIAHELAHYIYEKNKSPHTELFFAVREEKGAGKRNQLENEMDYLAAAILVPRESLKKDFKEGNVSNSELAIKYGVEQKLMDRRMSEVFG